MCRSAALRHSRRSDVVADVQGNGIASGIVDHGGTTAAPRAELPYLTLIGAFTAGLVLADRLANDAQQRPIRFADLPTIGVASHDIARVLARDRIATVLRAPFASGEAAQYPRGSGLRRAIGELVTCPHCLR